MKIPPEYKSLSDIAKKSGIALRSWIHQSVGRKAIIAFRSAHPEILNPIATKEGKGGGTYAHPLLAAQFASWCDPTFVSHVVAQNTEVIAQNIELKIELAKVFFQS